MPIKEHFLTTINKGVAWIFRVTLRKYVKNYLVIFYLLVKMYKSFISLVDMAQCGNVIIFLSFRFYVKSTLIKWSKRQFLRLSMYQNWFHVKSKKQKNSLFSTLCVYESGNQMKSYLPILNAFYHIDFTWNQFWYIWSNNSCFPNYRFWLFKSIKIVFT